eukprot:1461314-Alexandrium_andersonii.AAC.1
MAREFQVGSRSAPGIPISPRRVHAALVIEFQKARFPRLSPPQKRAPHDLQEAADLGGLAFHGRTRKGLEVHFARQQVCRVVEHHHFDGRPAAPAAKVGCGCSQIRLEAHARGPSEALEGPRWAREGWGVRAGPSDRARNNAGGELGSSVPQSVST